jgi:hypothetical protein
MGRHMARNAAAHEAAQPVLLGHAASSFFIFLGEVKMEGSSVSRQLRPYRHGTGSPGRTRSGLAGLVSPIPLGRRARVGARGVPLDERVGEARKLARKRNLSKSERPAAATP